MDASYAISVRRASVLPAASFRFHLAMDTLAVRLTVPAAGPVEDLHLQVIAPCRAHIEKALGWFAEGFVLWFVAYRSNNSIAAFASSSVV